MNEINPSDSCSKYTGWKRVAILAALFLFVIAGIGIWWLTRYAYAPGPDNENESVIVVIEKGASVRQIGETLARAGLIKYDIRFPIIARLSGDSGRLKAGEFRLLTGKSVLETIRSLVHAKVVQHTITLPEGLSGQEMAMLFEERGLCDSNSYLALMGNSTFIRNLGMEGVSSLEGYLFPDTYYFTREQKGAEHFVTMQVRRFHKVWEELTESLPTPVDREKIVTLASIVEKETGAAGERSLIAGVFYNRLKKNMRLQSDPTVVYGVDNFDGTITKKHLKTATPYNTYVLQGLPAGPIANPGKDSLHAALYPAITEYLYFVSQNDGTHYFSKTLREHNRAVQKYQRKKSRKSGKQKMREDPTNVSAEGIIKSNDRE
ncbi:endolytic transglycosylase MltG [Desulfopila sp. IMCC35008]|uniref:endolytic transglycosylase MltG n=1 Tax=Desulfopila sp. IMCC35008 TaxID=2653858 RepID=UPI001F0D5E48|nr:endolytic transglycosylase MltG [Desulfopila sp. IMCC35008]